MGIIVVKSFTSALSPPPGFSRLLASAIALVVLQGCSAAPESPVNAQTYFRGLVRAVDNQLQLRACNRVRWESAGHIREELREAIIERLAAAPMGVGVYLEAWGEPGKPISELQMLGGDIATCRHQLEGIELRAGGLDPVWYADLKAGVLEVHDSTRLKSWRLTSPELSISGNRWRWQGERTRLTIRRTQCFDKLGVEYALSADFSAGATQLKGCARYGDLQRMLLKTRYYSRDSKRERQIGLQLIDSLRFDLSLISSTGERENYGGSWRMLSGGQLLLQIEDQRLRGSGRSLRFLPEAGLLRLANSHPLLGRELTLYPGTEPLIAQKRLSAALP